MLDISNLLGEASIPSNYYATDAYVKGDFEAGLLEDRAGSRLLALPDTFLQGIYAGIEEELGEASHQVLFSCGQWWGKNFFRRFSQGLSNYHQKPFIELEMVEFLQSLKQCWKTHGWGSIELDMQYRDSGFIVVRTSQSSFAKAARNHDRPNCSVEAGFLSAFFSQLSGEAVHCVQTTCESMGVPFNTFIVGNEERLKPAEAGVKEGESHTAIVLRLCPDLAEE